MKSPSKFIGVFFFGIILVGLVLLTSCGQKPQYKTALGKKKLKYYNSVQYGKTSPKEFKSFNQKRR
ncbi:hypothetical protein FNH22_03205 [Fulvivirga sp. M361]|nr:hypothetical protein FNH22_03205 [Fulvivirga sp. M361]